MNIGLLWELWAELGPRVGVKPKYRLVLSVPSINRSVAQMDTSLKYDPLLTTVRNEDCIALVIGCILWKSWHDWSMSSDEVTACEE